MEFGGVSFSIGEKRVLDCQHGSKYYKQRKPTGKHTRLQGTRKMGCNAHIVCQQYILYPDYEVPKKECQNKRKEKERRQENLKRLRRDLTLTPKTSQPKSSTTYLYQRRRLITKPIQLGDPT